VSFRGLCCGTVCVAAGGRVITLLVLVDRLHMVICSSDVPCRCQVVVFACRVNRCVSHEESFEVVVVERVCWSQGQLMLPSAPSPCVGASGTQVQRKTAGAQGQTAHREFPGAASPV
jgi:hypothetical protein